MIQTELASKRKPVTYGNSVPSSSNNARMAVFLEIVNIDGDKQ